MELTVFTLHLFLFQHSTLRGCLHTCRATYQPIPSAAVFQGYVRARKLIELPSVVVVGMRSEESNFRPPVQSLLVNAQTIGHLLLVQHSPLTKSIIARTQAICVHEIGYVLRRKAVSRSAWSRGCSRAKPSLIKDGGDFGIDMFVEQSINQCHDLWWCL